MSAADDIDSMTVTSGNATTTSGVRRRQAPPAAKSRGRQIAIVVGAIVGLLLGAYLIVPLDYQRDLDLTTGLERTDITLAGWHVGQSERPTPTSRWVTGTDLTLPTPIWVRYGGFQSSVGNGRTYYAPNAYAPGAAAILRAIQRQPADKQEKLLKTYLAMVVAGPGKQLQGGTATAMTDPLAMMKACNDFAEQAAAALAAEPK